jgi:hypothetical protein
MAPKTIDKNLSRLHVIDEAKWTMVLSDSLRLLQLGHAAKHQRENHRAAYGVLSGYREQEKLKFLLA